MFRVNFQTDQPDCDLGVYVDNSGRQWEFDLDEHGEEFIEDDEGRVFRLINKYQHEVTEQVLWIDVEECPEDKKEVEVEKPMRSREEIQELIKDRKIYINHLRNEMVDTEKKYEDNIRYILSKDQFILDNISVVIEEWKKYKEHYLNRIDSNTTELNILEWLVR